MMLYQQGRTAVPFHLEETKFVLFVSDRCIVITTVLGARVGTYFMQVVSDLG